MAKKTSKKAQARMEEKKEFDEEILQIDRVTRVVKGGRRLRFRVTVAIGDRKGRVGLGIGKAAEVLGGIRKAVSRAKKNLIKVPITKGDTIPHSLRIKYKAAEMIVLPAAPGTGVIAGGALRKILNLSGVKNVLSKNLGSRNTLIVAQATMEALKELKPVKEGQAKVFKDEERKSEKPHEPRASKKAEVKKKEDNKKKEKEDDKKKPEKAEVPADGAGDTAEPSTPEGGQAGDAVEARDPTSQTEAKTPDTPQEPKEEKQEEPKEEPKAKESDDKK